MSEICPYSGLPYCCSICPELDDLKADEKCPLGVSPNDFSVSEEYYNGKDHYILCLS